MPSIFFLERCVNLNWLMGYQNQKSAIFGSQVVYRNQTVIEFTKDFSSMLTCKFHPHKIGKEIAESCAKKLTARVWQFLADLLLRQNCMQKLEDIFLPGSVKSSTRSQSHKHTNTRLH
jgi:hypothetical protein